MSNTSSNRATSQQVGSDAGNRSLDGVRVPNVVSPQTFDEVSDALREAHERGQVVVPWGGGTMMGLGNLPESADVALDLTALDQVISYEPDDLTIAVQAGCRIADLMSLLAENGQMLPFDAANPEHATVGGLFASGVSGPRRFGYGGMRDLVIGITSTSPNGELSRGGGMVVKNVSGYDMMRLHYGALGALGVVLQLNFKVLPAPRASRTVVLRFDSAEAAMEAAMRVRESPLAPTSIVALDDSASASSDLDHVSTTLLLRADGPEGSVGRQAERLLEIASGAASDANVVDDEQSAKLWSRVNGSLSALSDEDSISVRLGVAPSAASEVLTNVNAIADQGSLDRSIMTDLGNGQIFVRLTSRDGGIDELSAAWSTISTLGEHATLLAAPVEVKRGTDVFGPAHAGFAVIRALKQQFDPSRTLNRGRFIGHL